MRIPKAWSFLFLSAGFIFLLFSGNSLTHAASASDLVGQVNDSDAPLYTTNEPNNGPNNQGLVEPFDVAVDTAHHRLFVSDKNNARILVFNLDSGNNLIDRMADFVLGQSNFRDHAPGLSAAAFGEWGSNLAYDNTNDRLFVVDTINNRVLVFDTAGITNGEDAVHVLGQTDFTSGDAGTGAARFDRPVGAAYDSSHQRLFVGDIFHNRVLVFDLSGGITDGMNATYALGQTNFSDVLPATSQNQFYYPAFITYDPTNNRLFVADGSNNRIMVFNVTTITNGMNATGVLGQPDFVTNTEGISQSKFTSPGALTVNTGGTRLYLTDGFASRVLVFDVTTITNGENAVNVLGQANYTNSTPATTQDRLQNPNGISLDNGNNFLYVSDSLNNRVVVYDVTTITNGENAVNGLGQLNDNGAVLYTTATQNNWPTRRGFDVPAASALDDANHRLFVTDKNNNRVLVFSLDTSNNLTDRTADFVLGQANFRDMSAGLSASKMNAPQGLAYDATSNRLYVADSGNNRVIMFNVGTITNGMAATRVLGQGNLTSGTAATAQNRSNYPTALALNAANNRLYVADTGNSRVLIFNVATVTNGENAVNVLGQANYTSADGDLSQNRLYAPTGLVNGGANLYVADNGNNRVMVFDITTITNGENAVNVLGQPDFVTTEWDVSPDRFYYPYAVAYDATRSRLYVSDSGSNRVMIFDVTSIINGENAIEVLGQPDFTSSTPATTQDGFSTPTHITINSTADRLYVSEENNYRVMIFDLGTLPLTAPVLLRETDGSTVLKSLKDMDTYTIALGEAPTDTVVVTLAADPALILGTNTVTFTPDNWGPQSVTVRVNATAWERKIPVFLIHQSIQFTGRKVTQTPALRDVVVWFTAAISTDRDPVEITPASGK